MRSNTFLDDPSRERHSVGSSLDEMALLGKDLPAFADVRKGLFGWEWIKAIKPINAEEVKKLKLK